MKKKVLIIGHSAKEEALAKILSERFEVYVSPGNDSIKNFATCVDIREQNVIEILNFALENDIELTIASSEDAIRANIAELFNDNGLMIFAPNSDSAQFTLSRSIAKKLFYKLRLPTPRFAVYEKKNLAIDYLKKCEMPVVIKTDNKNNKNSVMVCPSDVIAKSYIEDCFFSNESKVIIEEYIYGTPFSFYVVTDGYKALPLGSTKNYKFSLEGDGGLWTEGMGACSPFTQLTYDHEDYIMNEIVYPVINYLSEGLKPYLGIICFEGVLTPEGDIAITECSPFLADYDADGILALLNEDIYNIFYSCVTGAFSDDYDLLDFKEDYTVSCVLSSGQFKGDVISGLDDLEENILISHINTKQNEYTEFETTGGRTLVVTATGKTLNRASERLYDEINAIDFKGKTYRKDICRIPVHI